MKFLLKTKSKYTVVAATRPRFMDGLEGQLSPNFIESINSKNFKSL